MARARRGRHEGGCFQRSSDGLWVASKSCGTDPQTGKRVRLTAYGTTKQEAIERLDELRAKAKGGFLPDATKLTVNGLLDQWLSNLSARAGTTTTEERRKVIGKHLKPRLGRHLLDAFTPFHVETLYSQMRADGVPAGAMKEAAKHLSTALNFATKLRLVPSNPASGVARPRGPRREMVVLDADQARAVAAGGGSCGVLVLTALASGCRMGELLALRWDDLDLKAGTLSVNKSLSRPKGGFVVVPPKSASGRRTVTLPPSAVASLVAHKAAALKAGLLDKPVFCVPSGGFRHPNGVRLALNRLVRTVNREGKVRPVPAKLRFHDLRHTHASLLISGGASLRAVSARLGHKDPAMTLRIYSHVMPTDDAALAARVAAILG